VQRKFAALNSMEELAFTCGGDFEAKNDLWVMHKAFASFCHALVRLEASRKGGAKLMSASPGELDLTVRAISPLGAMAVEGTCGYPVHRPHGSVFRLQPRLGNPRAAEARR